MLGGRSSVKRPVGVRESYVQADRWVACVRSSGRSRDGVFSNVAKTARLAKQVDMRSQLSNASQPQSDASHATKQEAALTRKLKGQRSADEMVATLLEAKKSVVVRTDSSIHLSAIFTSLPGLSGSYGSMQQIVWEVIPDLVKAIDSGFPHQTKRQTTIQGVENVAWGLIQLQQRAKFDADFQGVVGELETQVLRLLDKHLDKTSATEFAVALDCFAEANYPRLDAGRISTLMVQHQSEANSQDLTRYFYVLSQLGIEDSEFMLALRQGMVAIADEPQSCSNSILALARQGVDAEEIAQQLAVRLLSLGSTATEQAIANTLLAMYERGWVVDNQVAVQLLERPLYRFDGTSEVGPYSIIQALRGVERHVVVASNLDLSALVSFLIEKCPLKLYNALYNVASSMYSI